MNDQDNKTVINGVSRETFAKAGNVILDACISWFGQEPGWESFIADATRDVIELVINDIKNQNQTKS